MTDCGALERIGGGVLPARTKRTSSNVPPVCPLISNKQGGGSGAHLKNHLAPAPYHYLQDTARAH